jgi:hypothetical protein
MWLVDRQPLIGRTWTGFPLAMKVQNHLSLNLNLFATSSSLSYSSSHFLSSSVFIFHCNLILFPVFAFLSSSSCTVASTKIIFFSSYYPATQDLRAKQLRVSGAFFSLDIFYISPPCTSSSFSHPPLRVVSQKWSVTFSSTFSSRITCKYTSLAATHAHPARFFAELITNSQQSLAISRLYYLKRFNSIRNHLMVSVASFPRFSFSASCHGSTSCIFIHTFLPDRVFCLMHSVVYLIPCFLGLRCTATSCDRVGPCLLVPVLENHG